MRGRKPEAAKVVTGAFPASAVDIAEPEWINAFAAEAWQAESARLASEKWRAVRDAMTEAQTLATANAGALEALAVQYARWRLAEDCVARDGPVIKSGQSGVPMQNPYLSIANSALTFVLKLESELGLPPTMRERVGRVAGVKRKGLAADGYLKPKAG